MKKALVTIFMLLCLTAGAHAATYYVNPGESIQDAIEAADNGDTIIVKPDVYYENINMRGKAVTLMSEQGADSTVIDGKGLTVVLINSGEDSSTIIDGFTLRYGIDGVCFEYGVSPTVKNCKIYGNVFGIYCYDAAPIIADCNIVNSWEYAVYALNCDDEIMMSGCLIEKATAGIYQNNSSLSLSDCLIADISKPNKGIEIVNGSILKTHTTTIMDIGGLALSSQSSSANLLNTYIMSSDGGIDVRDNSTIALKDCAIFVTDHGIMCVNSSLNIVYTNISYNGGFMMDFGEGTSQVTIKWCKMIDNGRGIWTQNAQSNVNLTIINSIISGNMGAGFYGIDLGGQSNVSMLNCTITEITGEGGGIRLRDQASAVVKNSVIWNEETSSIITDGSSSAQVDHSIIKGGWGGDGNMGSNPMLDYDYAPMAGSPCIDAGDNTVSVGMLDVDKDFRYVNSTSQQGDPWDGTILYKFMNDAGQFTMIWKGLIDIGAKEYQVFQPTYETFHVLKSIDLQAWEEVFVGNNAIWSDTESVSTDKGFYRVWSEE